MAKKRISSLRLVKASNGDRQPEVSSNCYEGERLDHLLFQLTKSIESAKLSKGELPDKIWIKFAIGVNDVTRVLERMIQAEADCQSKKEHSNINLRRAPLVPLQVVLLAADCNPRRLTKHIPSLASSTQIPVIFVKDNKRGSLRLGELVKLKTAMAIGIKVKGSKINEAIDELLNSHSPEISPHIHDLNSVSKPP